MTESTFHHHNKRRNKMIIDLILDTKASYPWLFTDAIDYIREEEKIFEMDYRIWEALASEDRKGFVKRASKYIIEQGYNPNIKRCLGKVFDAIVSAS
ncbi:MAG: hypothetical protein IKD78_04560 [Bacteroidales bacterium]|nr:hypothetical protein [Bacteroidales bacterium]